MHARHYAPAPASQTGIARGIYRHCYDESLTQSACYTRLTQRYIVTTFSVMVMQRHAVTHTSAAMTRFIKPPLVVLHAQRSRTVRHQHGSNVSTLWSTYQITSGA